MEHHGIKNNQYLPCSGELYSILLIVDTQGDKKHYPEETQTQGVFPCSQRPFGPGLEIKFFSQEQCCSKVQILGANWFEEGAKKL